MQRKNTALWGICFLGATISCSGGLVSVGDRDRDGGTSTGGSGSVGSGGSTTGAGGINMAGAGGMASGVGGAGGSAVGGGSPDAACGLEPFVFCATNSRFDPGVCRCVPDAPDAGCISGLGGRCGGNTTSPCICASGLACRSGDGGLPLGDVGGSCRPVDSIPDPVSLDGGRHQVGSCPLIPPGDPGNPAVGACTLLGRWSLNNSHGTVQTAGVIEFDADGSYYGGPTGTDLSLTYRYDGSYSVSGSTFQLNFSCGDGTCVGSGTFDLEFQNNCAVAQLQERTTECTGNRLSVAGQVVLIR